MTGESPTVSAVTPYPAHNPRCEGASARSEVERVIDAARHIPEGTRNLDRELLRRRDDRVQDSEVLARHHAAVIDALEWD